MAKPAARVRKESPKKTGGWMGLPTSTRLSQHHHTITDRQGNALKLATSGGSGFACSRKSTPLPARFAAERAGSGCFGIRLEKPRR